MTNAKELRILGLSGVYNQVLIDEYNGLFGTSTHPAGIKNGNSNTTNELNFMKLLEHPDIDLGLELFKADTNFENWQKVNNLLTEAPMYFFSYLTISMKMSSGLTTLIN